MKAVAYCKPLAINEPDSLLDVELPEPVASGHDLLVKVKAIAVNPVDFKVRMKVAADANQYKVLGWDAVAEVVSVGDLVTQFKPGDAVYYAGDINRQGCNAEYQLVDERLVGHKPKRLSDAEAAALPLTSITAWELLFEHLAIKRQDPKSKQETNEFILVVGAAGGVGSILIQLIKTLTGAKIIATASRASSKAWVKKLGAHYVIDHKQEALQTQLRALGIKQVTHIASLNNSDTHFNSYPGILAPFGKIALIDGLQSADIMKLKPKSQSLHIEYMFARSSYQTDDMIEQSHLLNQVADLLDQNYIQSTIAKNLGIINAENLKAAHAQLESGTTIGKLVLQGF